MSLTDVKAPRVPLWNNPAFRGYIFQAIVLVFIVIAVYFGTSNIIHNMEENRIPFGFEFLKNGSGIPINQTLIPYTPKSSNLQVLWVGICNTLLVSILAIILATTLGFLMGAARFSRNFMIAKVATLYVQIFRNLPLLLLLVFIYRTVPIAFQLPDAKQSWELPGGIYISQRGLIGPMPIFGDGAIWVVAAFFIALTGSGFLYVWAKRRQERTGQPFPIFSAMLGLLILLPLLVFFAAGSPLTFEYPVRNKFSFSGGVPISLELIALTLGLAINTGTYIAEAVRSGINAVSHGQTEAALALGLSHARTMRLVVLPQAMRVVVPPLNSFYIGAVKNSSLAVFIGYPDIVSVFTGSVLSSTAASIQIVLITMGFYLSISLTASLLMNMYNKRVMLKER